MCSSVKFSSGKQVYNIGQLKNYLKIDSLFPEGEAGISNDDCFCHILLKETLEDLNISESYQIINN